MVDYTFWVDRKLDLIITFLREGEYEADLDPLIEDLRICHDQARDKQEFWPEKERYRVRCSKLLIAAGIMKRTADGRGLHYLDALEGVLLAVLTGKAI